MAADSQIDRALSVVAATLNDHEQGVRVGAVRRSDSGEWIADRQNNAAARSDTAIPARPPHSRLRVLLTKLKTLG